MRKGSAAAELYSLTDEAATSSPVSYKRVQTERDQFVRVVKAEGHAYLRRRVSDQPGSEVLLAGRMADELESCPCAMHPAVAKVLGDY